MTLEKKLDIFKQELNNTGIVVIPEDVLPFSQGEKEKLDFWTESNNLPYQVINVAILMKKPQ